MASDHLKDAKIALGILLPKGTSDEHEADDTHDSPVDGDDGDVSEDQETAGEHFAKALEAKDYKGIARAVLAINAFEKGKGE